jgi:Holliday junction DNA helicase RuvA
MIGFIAGKILVKDPTYLIVDVQGIGYEIRISLDTYAKIKNADVVQLQTYLHVKEDSLTLYGFLDTDSKKNFLDLLSINGVGPSTAMMVQSSLDAADFRNAVVNEDVRTIQSVKGIGGKTAQRIVLELKDKFKKDGITATTESVGGGHNSLRNEALSALMTLGIGKPAAEKSIQTVLKKAGGDLTLEELIKQALKTS